MSLWQVTIEYTGRKIYDIEIETRQKAKDLAIDCFCDETMYEDITDIYVEEIPLFSKSQIDEALKDAEKFCDTSKQ